MPYKDPEKIKEYQKKYREEHKSKAKEYNKKYHKENKDKISLNHKKYCEENKEKLTEWKKNYYQENKSNISVRNKKYLKKYNAENKDKIYARNKKYRKQNKKKITDDFRRRRNELSRWLQDYKSTLCCIQCGENHVFCLEFHHKDPSLKKELISKLIKNLPKKEVLLEEISKCEILCSNCHRKHHYQDRFSRRTDSINPLKERRRKRAQWFWDLKCSFQCKNCGIADACCLDFHHKDSSQKIKSVSQMVLEAASEKRILAEIEKCEALCSNCHRKHHYEEKTKK